jgi:hypothetical protein
MALVQREVSAKAAATGTLSLRAPRDAERRRGSQREKLRSAFQGKVTCSKVCIRAFETRYRTSQRLSRQPL